jgi:ubiquinol-cytochrome c reductase cytochrome b subunit
MLKNLTDWLHDRTGYRSAVRVLTDEPVAGGTRWAYVFGSALFVLLIVQMTTGVALGVYYSASTTDAWASVNYLQTQVTLGWVLRGLHHFGASAMVVLVAMHMIQTVWFGAFKAPREVNWLTGFALLQLVLAFALTGYLLPWDQKGYWATQVATSIIGTLPVIGPKLQVLVQGGNAYGNLTLTRFYAVHVFLLPAGILAFTALHLVLFRRHGVTVAPSVSARDAEEKTEPFFPKQLLKDAAFSFAVLLVVLGLTVVERGAPLAAPADPSSQYLARPEWYFLPLFQLLKYFEGSAEIVGTVVLPGIAMTFLALLPFLHAFFRKRIPSSHRILSFVFLFGLLCIAALGVVAVQEDAGNPAFAKMEAQAHAEALEARRLAALGVPARGPLFLYENDPVVWGRKIFKAQCLTCHHPCTNQPYKGDPCLANYASRDWLKRVIREPRHVLAFGNTTIDEMDSFTGPEASLDALAEFLYAEGNRTDVDANLAAKGRLAFEAEGCSSCHSLDGKGTDQAPDLKAYATVAWLSAFIRAPGAPRFYGDKNQMDDFGHDKVSKSELEAVVAFLRAQAHPGMEFP